MYDCEEMILERQENIYDGIDEQDEQIEIRELNTQLGRYETVKTLTGESAKQYMYSHGIW